MHVVVSSRHMDLTPALKAHAEAKAGKLTKYFDRIQEIEVVILPDGTDISVEVIVNAEHKREFVGHHHHADGYTAINECVDKLERQLSDYKKNLRNRKHPADGATIRHD